MDAALEHLPVGLIAIGPQGETLYVNATFTEMSGYDLSDFPDISTGISLFCPEPELRSKAQESWSRTRDMEGNSDSLTVKIRSGETRLFRFTSVALADGVVVVTVQDETDARLALDENLRSRHFMGKAQALSGIGSFEIDLQGGGLSFSDHMYSLFGLEPGVPLPLVTETIAKWIHPDDQSDVSAALETLVNTGRPVDVHFRILSGEGRVRMLHTVAELEVVHGRKLIFGASRDVTLETRAREELAQREQYYRSLFENTGTALAIFGNDMVIRECNSRFVDLTGYSSRELVGFKKWSDFVAPEDIGRLVRWHEQRTQEKGKGSSDRIFEFTLMNRRGEPKRIHAQVSTIPSTQYRIASLIDISKRTASERITRTLYGIARAMAASDTLEELFGQIHEGLGGVVQATTFGIALKDETGLSLVYSSCLKELQDSACGGCREFMASVAQDAVVGGIPFLRTFVDFPGVEHISGKASLMASPLRVGNRIIGAVCVAHQANPEQFTQKDLELMEAVSDQAAQAVDRRMYEQALTRLNEDLEFTVRQRTQELMVKAQELEQVNVRLMELDKVKSQLISSVSHELRTPLTSILGFAKLSQKLVDRLPTALSGPGQGTAEIERIKFNLDVVSEESKRLTRLINDFLDLEKIESGRVVWRDQMVDASGILSQVAETAKGFFQDKPEVRFQASTPGDLPGVRMDPDRLHEVVLNLVSNAAKFTAQGEVELKAGVNNGYLRIEVSDTGPGIPESEQERIFDAFHTLGGEDLPEGKTPGTGLGLAIVKKVMDHYQGKVSVQSQMDRGSVFTLQIPLPCPAE